MNSHRIKLEAEKAITVSRCSNEIEARFTAAVVFAIVERYKKIIK